MMSSDYFGFLVGFLEKWTKSANLGNFQGPAPWCRDPTQQRRSIHVCKVKEKLNRTTPPR